MVWGHSYHQTFKNHKGFRAIAITKPYKFTGFGAIAITKPYKFIEPPSRGVYRAPRLSTAARPSSRGELLHGVLPVLLPRRKQHGAKPYKFIGFGDRHGPKPYEFIWFGSIQGFGPN
jgi:hypothetical protein